MKTEDEILKEPYTRDEMWSLGYKEGQQAERKECEIEKHKYAILCMRGREKEIEQAEQKKDFEKEVVSYYKGKKVTDADALLLRTAKNNFKEGQQAEQKRILELIDRDIVYFKGLNYKEKSYPRGRTILSFLEALKKAVSLSGTDGEDKKVEK